MGKGDGDQRRRCRCDVKQKKRTEVKLLLGGRSRGVVFSSHSAKQDLGLEAQDAIDKSKKWVAVAKSAVEAAVAPCPLRKYGYW